MSNLPDRFEGVNLDIEGFKLSMRDREIAFAVLMRSYTGETMQEIADRFGMGRENLYRIINKPEVSTFQAQITEQVFSGLYQKAVFVLSDTLENAPTALKLKAVQLVLQASGKLKENHVHEIKPVKGKTLQELEEEMEVLQMEVELLDNPRKIIDVEEL